MEAERIRPVGDSLEDNVDRCSQQHDSVEAVIDRALIRHAAGDEEPARAVSVNERLDLVKVPERLRPTRGMGLDDPAGIVGVNDAVPAAFQLGQDRRFPAA